ncbi:MAG TPA: Stp1/IreP family PP2C-type Ser/Thr phosphatase [Bacillota bacterium]
MLTWNAASDIGQLRDRNEDAYDVFELPPPVGGHVFAVADGMGGQRAGDVASRLAVQALRSHLLNWARQAAPAPPPDGVAQALGEAVRGAHRHLLAYVAEHPEFSGMGTTLTVLRATPTHYQYAHVGDSRLYLLRRGGLKQLSRDHALVADLLRSGQITEQQARDHPQRHVLTQALGQDGEVDVDGGGGRVQVGDVLILCTDGLTSVLADDELRAAAAEPEPEGLAERLVMLANHRGGPDNITVITVRPNDPAVAGRAAEGGGSR